MDSEAMALHELEEFGTALDPPFTREHDREMATARKELGERAKRPRVQLIDRLAARGGRATVRRIGRDSMDRFGSHGRTSGIRDRQIRKRSSRVERGPRPQDHPSFPI